MKFEDVRELHQQLDSDNSWDDEDHFNMQAYCRTPDELLVVRFGGFNNQAYLYRLPADHRIPKSHKSLGDAGIPICQYEDGVLYAGYRYYDIPEQPEPYDPNSGDAGVLDVDMDGDWKLSDEDYLRRVVEDQVDSAAYKLECAQKAMRTLWNN